MGRVIKTQGREGEVAVEPHSVIPDRFHEGMRLLGLAEGNTRRELHVERVWPHKGHVILKFEGIDSISDAEVLIGCELQVPREERAHLEAGWTYISDLAGCAVFDGEREVGRVADVRFGAGEAPLLIVRGKVEYEIPFAEAYIRELRLDQKQIYMELPEGLLEVNAPLTDEEKKRQGS